MAMHLLNRGGTAEVLLWVCFRILPRWLAALVCLLAVSAGTARAGIDEAPGSGQLLLQHPGLPPVPALLQHSRFDVQVAGMVAVVRLEQTFENASADWVEGVYVFPLPGDAAVRAMDMRVGDRRIVGRVRERQEAQAMYRQAASSGRKASLVSQQRPNLFQNRIANVAPGVRATGSVRRRRIQPAAPHDTDSALHSRGVTAAGRWGASGAGLSGVAPGHGPGA